MSKTLYLAGFIALGLSLQTAAFAADSAVGGTPVDSTSNAQPLPDQGNEPSGRKNTDYGTLEPGTADTTPGTNMPSTTRNADSTETHLPLAGANSFTQAEATRRLESQGYTQVAGLAKDDQSVWRGTAMKGGQKVAVALDYKGHITDVAK